MTEDMLKAYINGMIVKYKEQKDKWAYDSIKDIALRNKPADCL